MVERLRESLQRVQPWSARSCAASACAGSGRSGRLSAAGERLKGRRFRTTSGSDATGTWVSAEKGYLRETGNLIFHLALIGILVAVAVGHFFGFSRLPAPTAAY